MEKKKLEEYRSNLAKQVQERELRKKIEKLESVSQMTCEGDRGSAIILRVGGGTCSTSTRDSHGYNTSR